MPVAPIPPHIAAIERPRESLFTYYALQAVAANVAFPFLFPYLYFRYHTMRYRFDTDGIHMTWGIIFRREVLLNYSRIQDIHLRSNLIERWLGLARIEIQTASGAASMNMTLEGMEDPEGMRDFLYSRMRGSRDNKSEDKNEEKTSGETESVAAVLHEIASELREIRALVARPRA
jgi:putative membrane protein